MRKIRLTLFLLFFTSLTFLVHCTDDDFVSVCSGCDDPDFPWSAPGSGNCYATIDDCEAVEKGECTICN
ncbi:MAG: hypothetical protein RJQ14_27275 [Marinoscillum sp.]